MATHYNVAPRYTPGSPATVPCDLAKKVAREELHFIEHALSGAWGEEQKARAEKLGLRGIVESRHETRNGWEVVDFCTGERFLRHFPDKIEKMGFRRYVNLEAWEKTLIDASPPALQDYQQHGWFKVDLMKRTFTVYQPEPITA